MIDQYVTGSSGFIGRRLLKKLQGRTVTIPNQRIATYEFDPHHRFFWLSTYGNLVGQASIFRTWESNIRDVVTVLDELVEDASCGHFLFVSTSSVNLPVQTPYSRTKRAVEEMLLALEQFPSCIVRLYSVTGVGEQRQHLIPTLIHSCFTGTAMDFDPDATHDFIDVEDVVTGMLVLSKIKANGIYEFGNEILYTNDQVKKIVENVIGKNANVRKIVKMREYDNVDWCCKSPNEYWQPTKSLRQSIEEMVKAYKHE